MQNIAVSDGISSVGGSNWDSGGGLQVGGVGVSRDVGKGAKTSTVNNTLNDGVLHPIAMR